MDGVDHRDINMHHLRKQVALVGQEPVLFEVLYLLWLITVGNPLIMWFKKHLKLEVIKLC